MHVPPLHSHHTVKLLASSGLLKRLPSAICASVIALVCTLSPSTANGQAVVATGSKTATSGGNSSNNPSVNKPDNLAVGDLMIMSVCIEGGSDNNVTASGWTKITQQNNSSNVGVAVFWKIATSTDVAASSFSASLSQSKINSIGILRITGHNVSTPIAVFGGANSSTASAITTTAANQLVLTFHGVKKSSTFTASDRTEIYDVAANTASHAAYHYNQVALSSTGTKNTTLSQSAETVSIQVAIVSPAGPPPSVSTTGTPSALSTTYGTASTSTSFSVSGSNIVSGILVTPPSGFEVSTNNTTFTPTVTVSDGTGTINSTTVHLRLAANATAGAKSGNITLASGATSVNLATAASTVAAKALTGTFTASNKTYDGATSATVASRTVNGIVGSDVVNHTGGTATFADAAVGTAKIVTLTGATLTGAAASNYTLTSVSTATANITPKALTITGASATNRVYDGTTTVAVTGVSLVGVVSPDAVTLGGSPTGSVATAAVGSNKVVTVSGYSISGAQAGNYSLTQPTGLTVNVTAKPLTVTAPTIASKVYNATTAAGAVTVGTLSGFVGSETVTATAVAAAYSGSNVGSYPNVAVTYTRVNGTNGGLATNYSLAAGSATGVITPKPLSVTSPTIANKVYDGNTTAGAVTVGTLSGFVGTQRVTATAAAAAYSSSNAGTYPNVTVTYTLANGTAGGLATNYSLAAGSATGVITTKTLTGTFTASNKIYDGTASATVATRAVTGIVGSDDVNHTGGTATFANATVGTAKTVTLTGATLTGAAASNYTLSSVSTAAANITPLPLTITAAAASKASGEADPSLTYSSDGLLAGGSITGSLARASGETTGSYPITQGSLSAGSNYTISFTAANFVITGLKAMADSIQKPGTISALKIPVADLLANDGTLGANGEVVAAPNLTVTAAQTSLGAALAIRGQFILFLPTTNGEETLTYTVSNGTATSTATVTLTGEASAPPFSLAVIKRGTAAFSGGSTSVTHDFLGVPNQTYRIQYTTDLSTWTTAPDQSSGSTGSFSVTFTQSGDLAAAWNSQMFFRATKP